MAVKHYVKLVRSLPADGNQRTVWTIDFPKIAELVSLRVIQTGGTPSNFHVNIYSSRHVISESASVGDEELEDDNIADPLIYQVPEEPIESNSPGILVTNFGDVPLHYTNMDATGQTNKRNVIYVEIEPDGLGPMTFDLALGSMLEY